MHEQNYANGRPIPDPRGIRLSVPTYHGPFIVKGVNQRDPLQETLNVSENTARTIAPTTQAFDRVLTNHHKTLSEAPEPLLRPVPVGHSLPMDHLGPIHAPVEAIAQITSAPPEIAFQSVLATAALAT